MHGTSLIKRKSRQGIKQSFILFMVFMVTFSGMLPSIAQVTANALEQTTLVEPSVSKDVNGDDSKELNKGEDFNYNINVGLPDDLSGYESMEILDDLDNRLTIQDTSFLINGDATDNFAITEEGQTVSLELTSEQLEELAGKEIILQIVVQVKEDATEGENIENIAQIVINNNVMLETNSAVVTLAELEITEEEIIEDTDLDEINDQTDAIIVEDEEPKEIVEKPKKESEGEAVSKEDAVKSEEIAALQLQELDEITINDTDTYFLGSGYILQIDGNDPTIEKGRVQLDTTSITNALALGKNEDVFYANAGNRLYKIYPNGQTEFVTNLVSGTAAGAITPDGNEYVYVGSSGDQLSLEFYNLVTEETRSIPIQDHTNFGDMNGGDFAFDGNGNLWFARWQDEPLNSILAKVDTETGNLESVIPIVSNTDQTFSRAGAMGFLPNGKMLILGNYTPGVAGGGYLLELDLATGVASEVVPNEFGLGIQDAASRVYPFLNPEVEIVKSVSPTETVYRGDELTYTLVVQNTGNLASTLTTVTDELPEGTTYVPNSTTLNGLPVEDNDEGSPLFTDMYVSSPNESLSGVLYAGEDNAATITFDVNVNESVPSGTEILNVAYVNYDGGDETPSNEVENIVTDLPEIDACAAPVSLVNGSFEEGPDEGAHGYIYFDESEVPGWLTTDEATGAKVIEIWNYRLRFPGSVTDYPTPVDGGDRWAELNAYEDGMLYQDVETTPGQTIYWRLSHLGRTGVDTMQVRIGPATDNPYDTIVQTQMSTGNTEWQTYTGSYTVPAGQTMTRFGFEAVDTASGSIAAGNFLDDIFLGTEPCVEAVKTVSPEGEVYVGDELTYNITVTNNGGDVAADAVLEDAIPEGTEYVPGSLKIIDGPGTGDLTDEADGDSGQFDGEKIIVELGDLPNTNNLPNGVTVQFKVTALSESVDDSVINQAQVQYKDLLKDTEEEVESNEVENPVIYNDPDLESTKSSTLEEKADGNTDADNPEVGDTIRYTIMTQNVIEDSLVENLVISDTIPEGLTYVEGSLEVDGESVTDAEGDDAGHAVEGEVAGSFGVITDTEEHTVTFLVTVDAGQAGEDIINIAEVKGDNTDIDEPEEEVKIYPREPVLESEKLAENLEEDRDNFEVGDTVVYTIQTRNTVTDSLVENLVITDELPAGLEFVEGSLEVSHDGEGEFTDGTIKVNFGDVEDTEWRTVTFQAVIDSGQSGETIENVATVDGDNIDEPDEPTTTIIVDPKDPELESSKSSTLEEKAEGNTDAANPEVGDTIRYTITTQNIVEDSLVENLVISDTIPEGLTYVEGSLEVDGESVTDAEGDDAGHAVEGEVAGSFGDITDTEEHTVTFLVTVDAGQAGEDIINIALVDSDNIDNPDEPEEVVKIYPREPNLESEKTAANLDKDKQKYEVGDTVVYTIKARNIVSDSLVENLTITDKLPVGLEYVDGSLEVSHEGTGKFNNGIITASFGDLEDTEWYTITFQAVINLDQSGETIKNVATIGADNVTEPNQPTAKIVVEKKGSVTPDPEKTEPPADVEKDEGQKLPKTATNMFNFVLLGIMAILVGLATLRIRKANQK